MEFQYQGDCIAVYKDKPCGPFDDCFIGTIKDGIGVDEVFCVFYPSRAAMKYGLTCGDHRRIMEKLSELNTSPTHNGGSHDPKSG